VALRVGDGYEFLSRCHGDRPFEAGLACEGAEGFLRHVDENTVLNRLRSGVHADDLSIIE